MCAKGSFLQLGTFKGKKKKKKWKRVSLNLIYQAIFVTTSPCVLNPERAGLFGPISQPGGGFHPPKISETNWRNIKCVVLVDSYDPPESIGTKKSTNIPCMTPQWRHKWRHVKNTKITKNHQNHGFSLFFQAKLHFLAMMCVKVCLHMFFLQINQINKIKHSESVSWKQKTRFVCNFHWKSVFGQFFIWPSALLRNAAS